MCRDPWLGKRGLIIATIFFPLASIVSWYSWTRLAVPSFYPSLKYEASLLTIVIALMAMAALAVAALGPRPSFRPVHNHQAGSAAMFGRIGSLRAAPAVVWLTSPALPHSPLSPSPFRGRFLESRQTSKEKRGNRR